MTTHFRASWKPFGFWSVGTQCMGIAETLFEDPPRLSLVEPNRWQWNLNSCPVSEFKKFAVKKVCAVKAAEIVPLPNKSCIVFVSKLTASSKNFTFKNCHSKYCRWRTWISGDVLLNIREYSLADLLLYGMLTVCRPTKDFKFKSYDPELRNSMDTECALHSCNYSRCGETCPIGWFLHRPDRLWSSMRPLNFGLRWVNVFVSRLHRLTWCSAARVNNY